MKRSSILTAVALMSLALPACHLHKEGEAHHEAQKIVVTSPEVKDVTITQPYVCQIHSRRHIEVRALQEGYLEAITVKEGQTVKEDDVLFKVIPIFYQARLEAEEAEAKLADIKLKNTKFLFDQKVAGMGGAGIVSEQEVLQYAAELAKAQAKVKLAQAELDFTKVKAPFDGVMDRLYRMQGSLVKKDEILTTLSDNSVMWVYFNVPEARYLEYKARQGKAKGEHISQLTLVDSRIELVLANNTKFDQPCSNTVTVEGTFNNETGNIAFRADFPNPDRVLRHGQTGTVLIHQAMKNAVVIPQRATFERLDKLYVWAVGEDGVAHQRPITVLHELEDVYVIKSGVDAKDKIVLEGGQLVHDGDKVEYEFEKPGEALSHQKYHAE
jgi:membrane fusion protein (multidrug efflux system)